MLRLIHHKNITTAVLILVVSVLVAGTLVFIESSTSSIKVFAQEDQTPTPTPDAPDESVAVTIGCNGYCDAQFVEDTRYSGTTTIDPTCPDGTPKPSNWVCTWSGSPENGSETCYTVFLACPTSTPSAPTGSITATSCTTPTVGGTCSVPITWSTKNSYMNGGAFSQVNAWDINSGIGVPVGGTWDPNTNYFQSTTPGPTDTSGSITKNLPKGSYLFTLYGAPSGSTSGNQYVTLDSASITVSEPTSLPDYRAGGLWFSEGVSVVALWGQNVPYGAYFNVKGTGVNIGLANGTTAFSIIDQLDTNNDGTPDAYHGSGLSMDKIVAQQWANATGSWDIWSQAEMPPGQHQMRTCLDTTASPYIGPGTVGESNENNNCGVWVPFTVVCPSGQIQSGNTCVVSADASGSLTITPCTLSGGATTCSAYASWNVSNATSAYVELTGGPSTGGVLNGSYGTHPNGYAPTWGQVLSGVNKSFTVAAGTYTVYLMANGSVPIAQNTAKYALGETTFPLFKFMASLANIFGTREDTDPVLLAATAGTGTELDSETFTINPSVTSCPTPPLGNSCSATANSCGLTASTIQDDGLGNGSGSCKCLPVPDSSCGKPTGNITPTLQLINAGQTCSFNWQVTLPSPSTYVTCTLSGVVGSGATTCTGSSCNTIKTIVTPVLTTATPSITYTLSCKNGSVVTDVKTAKCVIKPLIQEK